MKDKKGFTLIELLAVIIILGAVMTIAIPSISYAINNSRKEVYVKNAKSVINRAKIAVLEDNNYSQFLYDEDTTVYLHVNNIKLETGQISPFGELEDAYVVLAFNGARKDTPFDFYWISKDIHGNRIDLTSEDDLDVKDVYNNKARKLNNKAPIGVRNKIIIIDKDGNIVKASQVVEVTKDEAKECYSFQLIDGNNGVKEAKITFYDRNCGSDVTIPGIIEGYTVTTIYQYTFYNKGLTSVVIPGSVTTIESYAFTGNELVSVTLPEGLKSIGAAAFATNHLPSVYLPDGLTTISARAFKNNNISSFELPRSVKTIGSCAFCNNPIPNPTFLYATKNDGSDDYTTIRGYIGDLTEFTDKVFRLPAEKNGIALQKIANSSFYALSMPNWQVVIPDTVTEIGNSAFESTAIASVNLPDGLTKIGSSAFYNDRLTTINIPDTVTSIGALAFQNNYVPDTAPETMRWIYKRTTSGIDYSTIIGYSGKTKKNIVIPASQNGVALTELADSSIRYLSLTGGITIPSSVKKIGKLVFAYNNLTYIDNGDGDTSSPILYKRKDDGSIDKTVIISYGGRGTANVVIPSQVKELDNYAFYYTNIKGVEIPEGVTKIGSYAFQICKLEGTVVIPSTVTSIGTRAFHKVVNSGSNNGNLIKIVNKTGRSFNWQDITGGPSAATFVTGIVESWYGDIEVVDRE